MQVICKRSSGHYRTSWDTKSAGFIPRVRLLHSTQHMAMIFKSPHLLGRSTMWTIRYLCLRLYAMVYVGSSTEHLISRIYKIYMYLHIKVYKLRELFCEYQRFLLTRTAASTSEDSMPRSCANRRSWSSHVRSADMTLDCGHKPIIWRTPTMSRELDTSCTHTQKQQSFRKKQERWECWRSKGKLVSGSKHRQRTRAQLRVVAGKG